MTKPLVTVDWLNEQLADPDLIILDASTNTNKSNIKSDVQGLQIKGARFFDIREKFRDTISPYPNTLPAPSQFEENCRELGINQNSKIVIYDNLGVYTSPRVWWLFKVMGHDNVAVLNGGINEWANMGYKTEPASSAIFETGNFTANFQQQLVSDFDFIKTNIKTVENSVIDARSEGRFNGTAPEPREELQSGHFENALNLPFVNILSEGKYLSENKILAAFRALGIKDEPLTFTCGSGVTACIIYLAAELVLKNKKSVYDGSWTEWALKNNLLTVVNE